MSKNAAVSKTNKPKGADHESPKDSPTGQRLQKVLAAAGVGSRRVCEELIAEGRVEVDKQVITRLGTKVDPDRQKIRVDGVALTVPRRVYYAVNKPPGVVSTNQDPGGRLRVIDLIGTDQRVFTVGRLDKSSEGLIIVTNDGELANRLTHPRYGVEKTYVVHVAGNPARESLEQLERGVYLAEGLARVAGLKTKRRFKHYTELEIVLNEGRNREIRRLLARIGNKVVRLKRIGIGPLKLGNQPVGTHRQLTHEEVAQLHRAVATTSKSARRKKTARTGSAASARTSKERPQAADARRSKRANRPQKKRPATKRPSPRKGGR